MEKTEISSYLKFLIVAQKKGKVTKFKGAIAIGIFYFFLYALYAFALYIGSIFIVNEVVNKNTGKYFTAGDVMSCFFGIVFGVQFLGLSIPQIQAISEG